MSHTFKHADATFIYNSDGSGPITVSAEGREVNVTLDALKAFVAHGVRRTFIARLEAMEDDAILEEEFEPTDENTFDFGNGYVSAHRHPNGGGWVADTAVVEDTALVEENALVFGQAKVLGDAKVYEGAWVYDSAVVQYKARIYGKARVSGQARISGRASVSGNASVRGNAHVFGEARVSANARISEAAQVYEYARVFGAVDVSGETQIFGQARVYGKATLYGKVKIFDYAKVFGGAWISGEAEVSSGAMVRGNAQIHGKVKIKGGARISGDVRFYEDRIVTGIFTNAADVDFQSSIQAALKALSVEELADAMRVSWPTIKRWAEGRALPHPKARPLLLEALHKVLSEHEALLNRAPRRGP